MRKKFFAGKQIDKIYTSFGGINLPKEKNHFSLTARFTSYNIFGNRKGFMPNL
jgi:hypothetical protein